MKVPSKLASDFGNEFQKLIADFATEEGLIPDPESLGSDRYLSRSVVPHIVKLSALFNRLREDGKADQEAGLDPYWKQSSNPAHLRLAYFLYFMPSNLFRVASIGAELARLGFHWNAGDTLRAIEFGAGPATGACGIAAGEKHASIGLPRTGNWALIEQDKAVLELGKRWAENFFSACGVGEWGTRPFHRKLGLKEGFLPRTAPRFNLWLMSYFLNELPESPAEIAATLLSSWERHLDEEGIAILVEPALKLQSRKLLEIRRELLTQAERKKIDWLKVLAPCLGHQSCGALAASDDWCHEEVTWWRPPYFRVIDDMAELDRKTLPFSYLVVARSKRSHAELLPNIAGSKLRHRLVSPSHSEGKELEFFLCGEEGKRRARYRPSSSEDPAANLDRGDILLDGELRGDAQSTRIGAIGRVL